MKTFEFGEEAFDVRMVGPHEEEWTIDGGWDDEGHDFAGHPISKVVIRHCNCCPRVYLFAQCEYDSLKDALAAEKA